MTAEDTRTLELLDQTILDSLFQLGERRGKDLLGQLFGLFEQQGPKSFAALSEALSSENAGEVKSVAHSLKGSYRSLGTPRLAELSYRLEQMGTTGELAGGKEVLAELESCFAETREALKSFLESRGSADSGTA